MDDFRDKLYSDNLHNYDYEELIEMEELFIQDIENSISKKYKDKKKSFTCCPR